MNSIPISKSIHLAWRNIGRNPRRSLLTLLVISVGTASLLLAHGFILGTEQLMIKMSTELFAGQAQIHHPEFKDNAEIEFTVPNLSKTISAIESDPNIDGYSKRVLVSGMIASAHDSIVIQVYGVDFANEPKVSRLKRAISSGKYPSNSMERPIVLGYKVAEQLQVSLGDKVVITSAEAFSGELSQDMFRVAALTNFHSRPMDNGVGFIKIQSAQKLLKLKDEVHQVSLHFKTIDLAANKDLDIRRTLEQYGVLAEGWDELFPSLTAMMEMNKVSISIIIAILFALISLSILNTTFMSIFERMFEFGVLKALGTKSFSLGLMVVLECFFIGLLGVILGIITGGGLVFWFNYRGIVFSDFEYNGMSMVEPIKTIISIDQFTTLPLLMLFMCVIASIYPAFHAAGISPSQAMSKK